MPTILAKKTATMTCGSCGYSVSAGDKTCDHCGSTDIRKSFVLIKKAVADPDEELDETALDKEDEDDDVEDDDLEEEDFEEADDDEEEEESDEDSESSDEKKAVDLKDEDKEVAKYEALNLTTALADRITKALTDPSTSPAVYEEVMTEFNTVMDEAAAKWFSGKTVTKRSNLDKIKKTVSKRLTEGIVAKSKVVRPKTLEDLDLPDDVKSYIESLEGSDGVEVEKSEDIYKGLTPEAAEIVRKAAETNERHEQERWETIAKVYKHFPGDKGELAKTLRTLSESAPDAFTELKKTLDAAEHNLGQSDIFKNFGTSGAANDSGSEVEIRKGKAKKLVAEGVFKTQAQAEEHLLNEHYASTRVV